MALLDNQTVANAEQSGASHSGCRKVSVRGLRARKRTDLMRWQKQHGQQRGELVRRTIAAMR